MSRSASFSLRSAAHVAASAAYVPLRCSRKPTLSGIAKRVRQNAELGERVFLKVLAMGLPGTCCRRVSLVRSIERRSGCLTHKANVEAFELPVRATTANFIWGLVERARSGRARRVARDSPAPTSDSKRVVVSDN